MTRKMIIINVLLIITWMSAGCGGGGDISGGSLEQPISSSYSSDSGNASYSIPPEDTGNSEVPEGVMLSRVSGDGSSLLGPIGHLQGKHNGDAGNLDYSIVYVNRWGRTFVDAQGIHYYHDRYGGVVTHEQKFYPAQYYGVYPLYYIGRYMEFEIHLKNIGRRTYNNLRVIAIQEYLDEKGQTGEKIGNNSAYDWYVQSLRSGQELVLKGKSYISPTGARSGLDQTHLQIQHWMSPEDNDEWSDGRVIIDDAQAAVWCPPYPINGAGSLSGDPASAQSADGTN